MRRNFIFHFNRLDETTHKVTWKVIEFMEGDDFGVMEPAAVNIVDGINCTTPLCTMTRPQKPRAVMTGTGVVRIEIHNQETIAVITDI